MANTNPPENQHPSLTVVDGLLKENDVTVSTEGIHLAENGKVMVTGLASGQPQALLEAATSSGHTARIANDTSVEITPR